jgi:hypothetical protein
VGAEFVSLLLGIPNGNAQRTASYATQDKYWGTILPGRLEGIAKTNLNLGLRMEYESPVTERFDRSVTQWDATTPNPIAAAADCELCAEPDPRSAASELPLSSATNVCEHGQ